MDSITIASEIGTGTSSVSFPILATLVKAVKDSFSPRRAYNLWNGFGTSTSGVTLDLSKIGARTSITFIVILGAPLASLGSYLLQTS